MMNRISLQRILVDNNTVKYKYSVNDHLKKYFFTDMMFLHYDQDITNVPLSILTIPFVNIMAGLSWLTDAMIFVDEIDESFYNAYKQIKNAYSELHNKLFFGGILVPSVIKKNRIEENNKCLLLFGGGVDCHTSYLRNKSCIPAVVNIYGWKESELGESNIDNSDKRMTECFAHQFGIDSYHVSSNFASQFNLDRIDKELCRKLQTTYWYGFLHSMAFLSISVPIMWQQGWSNLMIAASFTKNRTDVHCGSFITTDTEFKFATCGRTIHDGFELSRQQKVLYLVDFQKTINKPYMIQACSFNDHNCCICEKCFRTIVELIAEGANPRDFGFMIDGSVTEHWKSILYRNIGLWDIKKESHYYELARERMKDNYSNIDDKEFVDWFLSFDFNKAKREGLMRYYTENFFSILKRKLHL